ncbi:MAG: 16S rRNA processing protein RimM [Clostridia bacterium]|nr:16S rRNA processing protein RimM [Clostridia bacterium]
MQNKYIECGKIINTHGCHGGLKLESWCDSPEVLADLKKIFIKKNGEFTEYKVKKAAIFKQFVLFDLVGLTDMDAALALKGTVIYADRDDFSLSEGEYFIADIIGSEVRDADSDELLGTLSEIINRGAQDIYVVKTERGEVMIPVVDEFVIGVEVGKAIYVRPIPGMFDEA